VKSSIAISTHAEILALVLNKNIAPRRLCEGGGARLSAPEDQFPGSLCVEIWSSRGFHLGPVAADRADSKRLAAIHEVGAELSIRAVEVGERQGVTTEFPSVNAKSDDCGDIGATALDHPGGRRILWGWGFDGSCLAGAVAWRAGDLVNPDETSRDRQTERSRGRYFHRFLVQLVAFASDHTPMRLSPQPLSEAA